MIRSFLLLIIFNKILNRLIEFLSTEEARLELVVRTLYNSKMPRSIVLSCTERNSIHAIQTVELLLLQIRFSFLIKKIV